MTTPRVFVMSPIVNIGDYIQKQAREEILVLENRRNRYETAIADLNEQIAVLQAKLAESPSTTLSGDI